MNCNKCGTPILPGENSCRFCGTVGDYSKRSHDEIKPEIIDFTTGDDDVVIIDDEPENIESIPGLRPVSIPVAPATPVVTRTEPIVTPVNVVTPEISEVPMSNSIIGHSTVMEEAVTVVPTIERTMQIPVVTPITNEPFEPTVKQSPVVSKIDSEPVPVVKKEEYVVPTVAPVTKSAVLVEPVPTVVTPMAELPVTTAVSASTPIIVTEPTSKDTKDEIIKEFVTPVTEDKKENKVKKPSQGLFNILTFILIVLLLVSIIVNCFLLMGDGKDNEEIDDTPVVSTTNQSVYFNGYKAEVPSNWITVTNKDVNYITLMDSTEDWAMTLNVAPNINSGEISNKTSVDNITKAFGTNKYLFTSDYSKTVDGKDFYIFKGKYYDYSVYVITLSLNNTSTIVADLKFKGEVDDAVLSNVLSSLTTVSTKDLTAFYKSDFNFGDITSLITSNVSVEDSANLGGN